MVFLRIKSEIMSSDFAFSQTFIRKSKNNWLMSSAIFTDVIIVYVLIKKYDAKR